MGLPLVLRTKADLDAWRTNTSGSIGFVPTMGSLHSGHVFLASTAREQNENTVVSIFVNPKQFAKGEDLESYPRTLDADVRKLKGVADVVFAPTNDTMYPTDFGTHITAGSLGKELCGQYRPPHFDGVVTVVYLLLRLVRPDNLYLGQKDYQQVVIVRRMVKDLMLNAKVVGVETQRDVRGLALSSRNQYLDEQQITEAAHIRKCLLELRESALTPDQDANAVAKQLFASLGNSPNLKPQYAEIRLRSNLKKVSKMLPGKMVALVAVFLGKARLIDNIEI